MGIDKPYNILLITTGGTIAQTKVNGKFTRILPKVPFKSTIEKITQRINDVANIGIGEAETYTINKIDFEEPINKDGSNITSEDWVKLISIIAKKYSEYDAFVITHGTNTLGYTSAALSFALVNLSKPVILTGAQVSFGYPGSDAEQNLDNAIRIASYKKEKIFGVLAVFGSMIITGTRVKKANTFDYDTFKAFNSVSTIGRIGNTIRIDMDSLKNHMDFWSKRRIVRSEELQVSADFDMRIASLTEYPGMSPDFIKALVTNENYPIKGIILRAMGAGDPNVADVLADFKNLRESFNLLREMEIPIVVTTQTPDGRASMTINEPGYLAYELGAIPAWDMSMESMTVKLAWLLGKKTPYTEMRAKMTTSLLGEIRIGVL